MSDVAIRIEELGKMYRIGGEQERYRTLRDSLTDVVSAPFKRARSLLQGQAYGAAGLEETIWALKDVSFEVKHGEVVGIIGRNGAGKSTLLKILSRITEPTEGYADVFGRVGALLEVGTGFHPELTGRENIYLNGAILGMSRQEIDRKFDEIVAFAEVERFIDTPVKHYSSGMGLRLGFAVAAHLEPEILIVDEVLAVGDFAFQKKCLGKMRDVASEGRTVLFVSHNIDAINNLTEKCALFEQGRCVTIGETSSVLDQYLRFSGDTTRSALDLQVSRGKVILLQTELVTSTGSVIHEFGKQLEIVVHLKAEEPVDRARISLAIENPFGQLITQAWYYGNEKGYFDLNEGTHRFRCVFPFLRLSAGTYYVTLHLSERQGANKLLKAANVCWFRVSSLDSQPMKNMKENHLAYIDAFEWDIDCPSQ